MNNAQQTILQVVKRARNRPGTVTGTFASGININDTQYSEVGSVGRDREDTRHDGDKRITESNPGIADSDTTVVTVDRPASVRTPHMDSDTRGRSSGGSGINASENRSGDLGTGGVEAGRYNDRAEGPATYPDRVELPHVNRVEIPDFVEVDIPEPKRRGRPAGTPASPRARKGDLVTPALGATMIAAGFNMVSSLRGNDIWQKSEDDCIAPATHLANMLNKLPPAQAKAVAEFVDPIAFVVGMSMLISPCLQAEKELALRKRIVKQNAVPTSKQTEPTGRYDNAVQHGTIIGYADPLTGG